MTFFLLLVVGWVWMGLSFYVPDYREMLLVNAMICFVGALLSSEIDNLKGGKQ